MRFLAAPWRAMLADGSWLTRAAHANAMAALLADGLRALGVELAYPVEANGVFARFSSADVRTLVERGWVLHEVVSGVTRLMCSWATTADDVAALLGDLDDVSDLGT